MTLVEHNLSDAGILCIEAGASAISLAFLTVLETTTVDTVLVAS